MNQKNLRYFELARRTSRFSDHRHHKMGAILINKNRVLNTGFNSVSTHPRSPNKWFSTHAEFSALLGIEAYKIRGASIYVVRSTITMPWATSKPCNECEIFMRKMGIRRIYYIDDQNKFATEKL